jgi:hypothetical protein
MPTYKESRFPFLLGTTLNIVLIVAVLVYGSVESQRLSFGATTAARPVWEVLSFALLCGAAASATIEILKRVFGLRGVYQRRQARLWLDARGEGAYDALLYAMGTRSGAEQGTFNLPNEQLAALVSTAADAALSTAADTAPKDEEPTESGVPLLAALARMSSKEVIDAAGAMRTREPNPQEGRLAVTLAQQVRAGVDQLQITLGERWRRYVQSAAVWISGAYGIALARATVEPLTGEGRFVIAAVILGGPLAWLFRDLAAAVERARS